MPNCRRGEVLAHTRSGELLAAPLQVRSLRSWFGRSQRGGGDSGLLAKLGYGRGCRGSAPRSGGDSAAKAKYLIPR